MGLMCNHLFPPFLRIPVLLLLEKEFGGSAFGRGWCPWTRCHICTSIFVLPLLVVTYIIKFHNTTTIYRFYHIIILKDQNQQF